MKCIVFAPGIMGSVLKDGEKTVWPPTVWEFIAGYKRVDDLLSDHLVATQPISNVGPIGIYGSLLEDFNTCGYFENQSDKKLIIYPYDWRQSNRVSAEGLADYLDSIFKEIPGDLRISFIGHSMGGLVMRYLLESGKFNNRDWFENIERLITMGTPHNGASLALFRLRGTDKYLGLSGPDLKKLANDPRYPSAYELVAPKNSALTTEQATSGELPIIIDPFDTRIAERLTMNQENIRAAKSFWSQLNIKEKPENVSYFSIIGSSLKTNIRNEWKNESYDPIPIIRKASGDGTVPIASSHLQGIPHIFSDKKHADIFKDRNVRKYLYTILDAPSNVFPQSAGAGPEVGGEDAIGISVDKEIYDSNEEIEVVVSFNKEIINLRENFEVVELDPSTGQQDPSKEPTYISVRLDGINVNSFSFTIKKDFEPGVYELLSTRTIDDPEPTTFIIRESNGGN